jgi:hypothetical protein
VPSDTSVDAKPPVQALPPDIRAGLRSADPNSWRGNSFFPAPPEPPNQKQSSVVAGPINSMFPLQPEQNSDQTVLTGRHYGPPKTEPAAQPPPAPTVTPGAATRRSGLLDGDCDMMLAGRKVAGFSLTCDQKTFGTPLGANAVSGFVGSLEECASQCRAIAGCGGFTYSLTASGSCNVFAKRSNGVSLPGWVTGLR